MVGQSRPLRSESPCFCQATAVRNCSDPAPEPLRDAGPADTKQPVSLFFRAAPIVPNNSDCLPEPLEPLAKTQAADVPEGRVPALIKQKHSAGVHQHTHVRDPAVAQPGRYCHERHFGIVNRRKDEARRRNAALTSEPRLCIDLPNNTPVGQRGRQVCTITVGSC